MFQDVEKNRMLERERQHEWEERHRAALQDAAK